MSDLQANQHRQKSADLMESNQKMLAFARQELSQGNMLQAKPILDSLKRNLAQNSAEYPLQEREQFRQALAELEYQLKEMKNRLTPKKKFSVDTEAN